MPVSPLSFIKAWQPPTSKHEISLVPNGTRGIYVLFKNNKRSKALNVVYVGMAGVGIRSGIRGRLKQHNRKKAGLWSHFAAFEVWDNITHSEVAELEGLFREIYRFDARANRLNKQRRFRKLHREVPTFEKRAGQQAAPADGPRDARPSLARKRARRR